MKQNFTIEKGWANSFQNENDFIKQCQEDFLKEMQKNCVIYALEFYKWAKENRHLEYPNYGPGFESKPLTAEEMHYLFCTRP